MECQNVVDLLSDYLDDDLPVEEARIVEGHLTTCMPCQTIRLDINAVRLTARELPLHTPNNILWRRICDEVETEIAQAELRFEPPLSTNWWQRLWSREVTFTAPRLAGIVAFALTLMISATFFMRMNTLPTSSSSLKNASAALVPWETELRRKVELRMSEFNERKASWDPQLRDDFEDHLQRIDQSLENCRRALALNSSDQNHQKMYLALYEEKLRLLEDINRLKW